MLALWFRYNRCSCRQTCVLDGSSTPVLQASRHVGKASKIRCLFKTAVARQNVKAPCGKVVNNPKKQKPRNGERNFMTALKVLADAFHEGGWGMWPILCILIVTVGIAIERAVFLRRSIIDKNKLIELLRAQVQAGNIQGAVKVCSGNSTPMTRILQAGLMRANRSEDEINAAMDEAALRELPEVEKRTGYLAMLGNLATLAGLLGTISGLIKSFASVAGEDAANKASLLSAGISEAMNCTAFGLGTGILGLAFFAWLNGRTQGVLDDIAEVRKTVANYLYQAKLAMNG